MLIQIKSTLHYTLYRRRIWLLKGWKMSLACLLGYYSFIPVLSVSVNIVQFGAIPTCIEQERRCSLTKSISAYTYIDRITHSLSCSQGNCTWSNFHIFWMWKDAHTETETKYRACTERSWQVVDHKSQNCDLLVWKYKSASCSLSPVFFYTVSMMFSHSDEALKTDSQKVCI